MSAGAIRPPGWYDDATDGALLRYWDGSGWTPHTSRRAGTSPVDERTRALDADVGLTARLPDAAGAPDHTTVPTPPIAAPAAGSEALPGATRMPGLAVVGAITAAASLVVASTALGVALGR